MPIALILRSCRRPLGHILTDSSPPFNWVGPLDRARGRVSVASCSIRHRPVAYRSVRQALLRKLLKTQRTGRCRRRSKSARSRRLGRYDYLQLIGGTGKAENRQFGGAENTRQLKLLARELDVPVIALCQVSRAVEARADKRSTLADLRESGAIEADADLVAAGYRDELYNPVSLDRGTAELLILKHRGGRTTSLRPNLLGAPRALRVRRTPCSAVAPPTQPSVSTQDLSSAARGARGCRAAADLHRIVAPCNVGLGSSLRRDPDPGWPEGDRRPR